MTTVAEILAGYAHSLRFEELPHAVVHEAKRRIIDSLGCALGAFRERPVMAARSLALERPDPNGATLLGLDQRCAPEIAAFVNGVMVRALDYNDTYLSLEPAHPSDNLSAALAVAEAQHKDGRELITALVVGYELQCRLCDAASLRVRGWDHVTYGALSTALVAGRLCGLTPAEMVHALGLAGVANIALRQTRVGELSMWKGCAFANAARNGLFAAFLAKHGMTGPAPLFEGKKGFFKLVSGPFTLAAFGGRGGSFKILDTYIKAYPAEYHAQTAIQAAREMRPEIPSLAEVARIEIESFDACVEIIAGEPEKWRPATRETADHSLPYCVAVALADGEVTLGSFSPDRLSDPKLRELMEKIEVRKNAEFTARYPEAMLNEIRIELKSGRVIERRVSHAAGHPKNPMTDGDAEEKFRRLSGPLLPRERIEEILKALWNLEEISDLGLLLRLFQVR